MFASTLLQWSALLNPAARAAYQPMTLGISPKLGVVAVGARDCPYTDASALFYFDLEKGGAAAREQGLGQCALARSAPSLKTSVACTGWNKVRALLRVQFFVSL